MIHDINKMNDTNHVIISLVAEKALNKTQYLFVTKPSTNEYEGNIPQHNKGYT